MYERDVTEDGNVSSALYVKKGKYGKPPIKGMMYIPDFKEDSKVPCSLPRAAGIKRKRVQTDAYSDRKFKKEKHEKLSIVGSTYQRDVAKDGNVSPYFSPPLPQHIVKLEVV
ncbi:uncharacterized protein LOC107882328 [Acyrthosiphon pisum]|uniref:Uncharacterized protein n=1 Tax=Acyrthosiphon pisum TaxID=7029 RepID=A0A8R2NTT3_ACYPI|nr:uncharacterized protein LOC107882328 [Acyrthosiphon pisum]